ncbi:efflux transporter outer membrane subunit [Arhodomonas sp. AD133]|uniref:efflux transporter outer membrane subunit n=1 Tax=Arhodomonas sp. AD133 TaxID=3415009 RepID=UPI003EBFE8CD
MHKRMVAIGALAILTGCAVGPDYEKPATPAPTGFNAAHRNGDFDQAEQRFWQGFDDPLLARLIDRTLDANQTLKGAMARYERAAALLDSAEQDRWPSVTASATAAETHPAAVERTPAGTGPERVETYRTGVAATWELDFFGRLRRATQAQRAELAAAGADVGALQVALTGQVASSYFRLRGLQAQYRVTEQNVALQATSLEIVDARVHAGRGTAFDRVRARAQLERTRAELPTLQAGIRAAMHRIAVLTGQPPAALIETLAPRKPLPASLPTIPVDSPGELLRRRPDIAAAERRLAAATARIGVATADLFPRFTLGGLLGSVAANTGDLFSGPAESRRIALGVDWTFLDRARVRARIDAADATGREALAEYRQTVLTALEETETRLERYHRSRQRVRRLRQAEQDARQAVELARTRYERGLIAYFEVLDAEQALTTTRDAAVRSRMAATLAMVDVYRALAGAPREPVDAVAAAE